MRLHSQAISAGVQFFEVDAACCKLAGHSILAALHSCDSAAQTAGRQVDCNA